ncbi:MAG: hypothetical protein AAF791_03685 [Bacteroidota bacterium]
MTTPRRPPRSCVWLLAASLALIGPAVMAQESNFGSVAEDEVTVRVLYRQHYTNEMLPLARVRVTARASSGRSLGEAETDEDGVATFACREASDRVRVRVSTAGTGPVRVYFDPAGWLPFNERSTAARADAVPCGGSETLIADRAMANTLVAMRAIADLYASRFGYTRGPVDVFLNRGNKNGLYSLHNNISFGNARLERPRGFRIMAHEYAHAYHHQALGGMPRGRCGASHYFSGADDFGCAYTEGFAHFASAVALTELFPALYGLSPVDSPVYLRILNNAAYPGTPERSDRPEYVTDGSVIEGVFAAFLWDLYDPPGTPGEDAAAEAVFDRTSYSLRYIADVMATCQWVVNGRYRDEDGTDRLVSCFQNRRVPYSERFFGLRYVQGPKAWRYRPTEQATEPPNWNPDDITRLWRHTFYGLPTSP